MKFKSIIIGLLIILSANQILLSQNKKNLSYTLSHPIKNGKENTYSPLGYKSVSDTFNIIAILVQFQEDTDPLSSGSGKFDLSSKYFNPSIQRDTVIDSPPYDSLYFIDHLEFLKNYYEKCSNGKVVVNYKLYGNVITLPKKMKEYSPQKNESFLKLGEFFKDSWGIADSSINFSNIDTQKTAFVIFHAGVGRDVDLTSIYGYDPTPYDLPTVYLGLKNLQEIYGNNYTGFLTNDGISIKNSLIIPSTELRELSLISGNTLLELGTNGIFVASFGSFLGLPDLFNTQTGKTAIGRFGLMDGQSIFSYNGAFPPEPSAWEKFYLGWISPIVVSNGEGNYKIKTSSSRNTYDSTVFKVLMNSREYFLIENRNRDPEYSGQRIFTRNRAFNDSTIFTKDVSGFLNYDITKIDGNLTNVKYFDWSLPGLIDDTAKFRGGILIWHIDENVILANLGTNSINNNINHKGIDLEEAKGSQDIGVTFNTPFGPVTGDGTFVDYWFNGNHYVPSNIYTNQFTPFSFPNSLSYSLANSNISITEFDTISPMMKFKINIGGDIIKPLAGYPKYIGEYPTFTTNLMQPIAFDLNGDGKDEFFVNNGRDLYGFRTDGTPIIPNQNGVLLYNFGNTPAGYAFSNNPQGRKLVVSTNINNGSKIGLFGFDGNLNLIDSTVNNFQNLPNFYMTAPPLIFDSSKVLWGSNYGYVYEQRLDGQSSGFIDTNLPIRKPVYMFSKYNANSYLLSRDPNSLIVCGNLLGSESKDSLILNLPNSFHINGNPLNLNYNPQRIYLNPILADVNKDEKEEIIFMADNKLFVINSAGILLDNFPVTVNRDIYSEICIADINNDGIFDIIYTSTDGDLYAYGIDGKMVNGFPIKTGISSFTPSLANLNDTLGIIVFGGDGYLYAYKTNVLYNETKILWKNYFGDKYFSNNNYKSIHSQISYSEKLPSERCYNWPNPAYDEKTFIRYYINGNAGAVNIKILDLSGELVTNLTGTSYSNTDNEVIWDVRNVQSGVYYGVIDAEIDGNKETKIIKIAIVK
jgi:M6 family metalloprotease-like protein